MKQNLKKALAVAATMLLLGGLSAQERIIEVLNKDNVSSLIREIDDTCWLVCCNGDGVSEFIKINETTMNSERFQLYYISGTDSMHVNDFEIFRDTVYFCGQAWTEDYSFAIWGYFPLIPFAIGNIYYHPVIDVESLNKIDVFSVDTTTDDLHVVMVGQKAFEKQGVIIDEVRSSPNAFLQYKSTIFDTVNNFYFDDIEVTDQHIAVSSSVGGTSVLFINKPALLWTSIFTGNATNYRWSEIAVNRQLEYCKNNVLALAYSFPLIEDIHVLTFNGLNPQYQIRIEETSKFNVVDLKFDKAMDDLELLTNCLNFFTHQIDSNVIIHLRQSMSSGGAVPCHKYENHVLNSLEWLSTQHKIFVASGHNNNFHHLHIYKYQYEKWEKCTEKIVKNAVKEEKEMREEKPSMIYYETEISMWELLAKKIDNPLKERCPSEF